MSIAKLKFGFKADAERISLKYRDELNLAPHDHLCAFVLSDHLNIDVIAHHDTNISAKKARNIGRSTSGWSAFTLKNFEGKHIIVHNNHQSEARKQSNVMHELAHIICKHELPTQSLVAGMALPLRNYDREMEDEAIWLGAVLQIPKEGLVWAVKKKMTKKDIAKHFKASEQMVTYRINMSGVKQQYSRVRSFYFL